MKPTLKTKKILKKFLLINNTDMENNHFDELLYSLPDYISGELDDNNIKEQIEAKLLTDSFFREEYDSLKTTMNFIRRTELEAPS